MSTSELPNRPAFQSSDQVSEFDRPPFSRMAYVAFAAGLVSLFAAFSTILLPLSMLAIAIGIAVVWKLSRDRQIGGVRLAQVGLAMAATSVAWSVIARAGKEEYMYREARMHAKTLLDTLARGEKYQALELRQVESARQLTGTDLAKYYTQRAEDEEFEGIQAFLDDPLTKKVIASGPDADWQFARGRGVILHGNETYVSVEMVNRASKVTPPQAVVVKMHRQLGLIADPARKHTTALWNFVELVDP